ncbi:MAG: hypothetical protein HQL69_11715 [Magnetococcales bacterium]|nr:hypothetical protein [Magnetococcales bacterium]
MAFDNMALTKQPRYRHMIPSEEKMYNKYQIIAVILVIPFFLGSPSLWAHSEENKDGSGESNTMEMKSSVHSLPPALKKRFKREMDRRHESMEEVMEAILSLDFQEIKTQANLLKKGSLLEKGLSSTDMKLLSDNLPKGFWKIDKEMAQAIDTLIEAVDHRDAPVVVERYGKLLLNCTQCHIQYGGDHFKNKKSTN